MGNGLFPMDSLDNLATCPGVRVPEELPAKSIRDEIIWSPYDSLVGDLDHLILAA